MRDCSRIWNWKFENNKTQFILITHSLQIRNNNNNNKKKQNGERVIHNWNTKTESDRYICTRV